VGVGGCVLVGVDLCVWLGGCVWCVCGCVDVGVCVLEFVRIPVYWRLSTVLFSVK
jgi:hypothetical protein